MLTYSWEFANRAGRGTAPPGSGAPSGTELTWSGTVPTVTFTVGTAATFSLLPYLTGFNPAIHDLSVLTGTLPTGVTLDPADGYVYNGTSQADAGDSMTIHAGISQADWVSRATASGVTFAYDMGSTAYWSGSEHAFSFDDHTYNNNSPQTPYINDIYQETTDGPAGRCMRIDFAAASDFNSNALVVPFDGSWTAATQGIGTTAYYVSFRFKIPATGIPVITDTNGPQGSWKWLIVGQYNNNAADPLASPASASHVESTFVLEDTYNLDFPQGYQYDDAGLNPYYRTDVPATSGLINFQNAYDRGAAYSPESERYCLYNTAHNGCLHFPHGQWMTFKLKIRVAQYGATNSANILQGWFAAQDATAWTPIWDLTNLSVGTQRSEWSGGLNGLHFTGYQTNRVSAAADFWMKWSQIIVSTQDIALPGVGA